MYCRKCGNQLDDDSKFCDKCGAKVELLGEDYSVNSKVKGINEAVADKNVSQKEGIPESEASILDDEKPFVVKDIKKPSEKKMQVWNVVILVVLVSVLVLEVVVYTSLSKAKKMSLAYEICVQNQTKEKTIFDELWADIQEDTDQKAIFEKYVRLRGEQIYFDTEVDVTKRLQQLQDLQIWGVIDTTYFQEQLQAEMFCNYLANDSLDVAISSLTGISESMLNRFKSSSFQKGEDLYQQYLQEEITDEVFLRYIQNLQACNILSYPIVDWSERLDIVSTSRNAFLQAHEQYTQKNYYEAFALLNGLKLHEDDAVYNEKIETLNASIVAEAKPHYLELVNSYLAEGDKESGTDIYKKLKAIYGAEDEDVKMLVTSLVEDWKMVYLEKLRELENTEVSTAGGTGCYTQFYLKDLFHDGDGIPEMIVFAPLDLWGRIKIFSYQNGLEEIDFGGENIDVSAVYYCVEDEGGLVIRGANGSKVYRSFGIVGSGKHEMLPGATGTMFSSREAYWDGEGGLDEDAEAALMNIAAFTQKEHMIDFYGMNEENYKKYLELGDLDI